jgi:hypothetical protein
MGIPEKNKSNEYNEELLNSFVDGELNVRQQTEVKRLMKNDSEIFRRVQKLQKCKMLISSMPRSKAPDNILSGVTSSLIGKALVAEKQPVSNISEEQGHLFVRKLASAAAMLSLAAVLTIVLYIIMAPGSYSNRPVAIDSAHYGSDQVITTSSKPSFNGRLELKAHNLIAVDSFINRAIEDSGLSDTVSPVLEQNTRVYSFECNRDELGILLFELEGIWNEFDSTKLFVETDTFSRPITVVKVNTRQIAEIISQDSREKIIGVAKDYAVLNGISNNLPANEIVTALDNTKAALVTPPLRIPKPQLTGPEPKPIDKTGSQKNIHLTIVLNR